MKVKVHAVAAGLALFTFGAGLYQHYSKEALSNPPDGGTGRSVVPPKASVPVGEALPPSEVIPEDQTPLGQVLHLLHLQQALENEIHRHSASGAPLSDPVLESIRNQEQEIARSIEDARSSLRTAPEAWGEVIEVLASERDQHGARRTLDLVREAWVPAAEISLADLLRTGKPAQVRRLALVALTNRTSATILAAIGTMAAQDPERSLRRDALTSLADRKGLSSGSNQDLLIRESLCQAIALESDPELRETEHRLLETLTSPRIPPPPRRHNLFGRSP